MSVRQLKKINHSKALIHEKDIFIVDLLLDYQR
jgi:hypothetical protein